MRNKNQKQKVLSLLVNTRIKLPPPLICPSYGGFTRVDFLVLMTILLVLIYLLIFASNAMICGTAKLPKTHVNPPLESLCILVFSIFLVTFHTCVYVCVFLCYLCTTVKK